MSAALDADLAALAQRLRAATVAVRLKYGGAGSGVIWSADGLIVTNAHVVDQRAVEVVLADGRTLPARLLRREARRDLAVLHVAAHGLPAAETRDAGGLRTGEIVVALGHPFGVPNAISVGIVHAAPARTRFVQADLRLAPGNSGGPLADARGRVVGINSMVVAGGLALAVPSGEIARFVAGLAPEERGRAA